MDSKYLSVARPKNEPCLLGAITYVHTSLLVRENGVLKVIIEKSRGEVSPLGQDTIENVS